MSAVGVLLWKDVREHRLALLAIAALLPLACAATALLLPEWLRQHPHTLVTRATVAAVLLVVTLIAPDLVPGDAHRGRPALLERLPAALGAAFLAKLALLLSTLLGAAAWGFASAAVVSGVGLDATAPDGVLAFAAALALGLACWTFAVSCWLPRGSLALPGTLLFLLLALAPLAVLVVLANGPWFLLQGPSLDGMSAFAWWWLWVQAPTAVLVAWTSSCAAGAAGGATRGPVSSASASPQRRWRPGTVTRAARVLDAGLRTAGRRRHDR